jgi:putative NADH-flavin reductase
MNVGIFGASGKTGTALVEGAAAEGHAVRAFVRDPASVRARSGVEVVTFDVLDPAATAAAIAGLDAVLSALGSRSLIKGGFLDRASANIIAGMDATGVKRLIVLGAAGAHRDASALQTAPRRLLFRVIRNTLLKVVLDDSAAQERRILASDLEYTIVHPPRLLDGPPTRTYRVADDALPANSGSISRGDVADFMLRALRENSYVRAGPYIAT